MLAPAEAVVPVLAAALLSYVQCELSAACAQEDKTAGSGRDRWHVMS
jgi:hypothetical protein